MTNLEISRAINFLVPDAEFTLIGDNFEDVIWLNENIKKPTLAAVKAEIANPTPRPEPTVEEKLASVGLNLNDLKTALGLNG